MPTRPSSATGVAAAAPAGRPAPAGSGPRWIAGQVGWGALGISASALAQWVVIAVLARAGGPTPVGLYAYGLAVATPVVLFASVALRTALVTDSDDGFTFADYLRLRVACMVAAVLFVAGLCLAMPRDVRLVVLLLTVAKAADGVGDIFHGLFQRHHRVRHVGVSLALNGLVTAVATTLLYVLTDSVEWAIVGSVLGSATGAVGYCAVAARRLSAVADEPGPQPRRPVSYRRMTRIAVVSLPLGLASTLAALATTIPRYQLEHAAGPAALGTFAALAYVVVAANAVCAAVGQVLLPQLTRLYATGRLVAFRRLLLRLVGGTLALGAVAVAAVAVWGDEALTLAYGPRFAASANVLTVLTASATVTGVLFFLGTALSAARRFTSQLLASTSTLVAAAVLGHLVIPTFTITGTAYVVVATTLLECAVKARLLRRALRGTR